LRPGLAEYADVVVHAGRCYFMDDGVTRTDVDDDESVLAVRLVLVVQGDCGSCVWHFGR